MTVVLSSVVLATVLGIGKGSDFWEEARQEEGEPNCKEDLGLRHPGLEKEICISSSVQRKQSWSSQRGTLPGGTVLGVEPVGVSVFHFRSSLSLGLWWTEPTAEDS